MYLFVYGDISNKWNFAVYNVCHKGLPSFIVHITPLNVCKENSVKSNSASSIPVIIYAHTQTQNY